MNIGELKEAIDHLDDDIEIRIAYQPIYPLRAKIANTVQPDEVAPLLAADPDDLDEEEEAPEDARFFWILATDTVGYNENPYASKQLWEA